jgi:hypothetical protein
VKNIWFSVIPGANSENYLRSCTFKKFNWESYNEFCYTLFVLALKLKSLRFLGIGVLTFFILAMSLSFVHHGFSYATSHSDVTSITVSGFSHENNQAAPDSLITDVFIGAVFLVLIVFRKYFHSKVSTRPRLKDKIDLKRLKCFTRPPNLILRLSLSQLGVLRI